MICGKTELEDSRENERVDTHEKPSILDMLVIDFDLHSDAILLSCPRHAEYV